jgi:hypothetical protein
MPQNAESDAKVADAHPNPLRPGTRISDLSHLNSFFCIPSSNCIHVSFVFVLSCLVLRSKIEKINPKRCLAAKVGFRVAVIDEHILLGFVR